MVTPGRSLRCGDRQFSLGDVESPPLIMGILNVTPDSFSDGGQSFTVDDALRHAQTLLDDGADILDVGGESTRPGAAAVDVDEERRRVIPVVEALMARGISCLSVDTRRAVVAADALAAGARWINDVSAFGDPAMPQVCAAADVDAVVLMHWTSDLRAGAVDDDVTHLRHRNVVAEVRDHLQARIRLATAAGIPASRILLDPGVGFGKSVDENVELSRYLAALQELGAAGVLYGPSRKRFIGALSDEADAARRDPGTLGALCAAVLAGADVVRVHNVAAARAALRVFAALRPRSSDVLRLAAKKF